MNTEVSQDGQMLMPGKQDFILDSYKNIMNPK